MTEDLRKMILKKLWRDFDPLAAIPTNLFEYDMQGWNSNHQYLKEAIVESRPKIVVEVGVWKGGSTIFMAKTAKEIGSETIIVSVDTWLGSSEHWLADKHFAQMSFLNGYPALYLKFASNVCRAGVTDRVVPLPLDSLNASYVIAGHKLSIDVLHLDGAHDYTSVSADLRLWWPLLAPGGVLVGDDYYTNGSWPGVKKAFDEFFAAKNIAINNFANGKVKIRKPVG